MIFYADSVYLRHFLSGVPKLEARTICRNFQRRDLVVTLMNEQGRQRASYFVAKQFEHLSEASTAVKRERQKLDGYLADGKAAEKEREEQNAG